MEQREEPIIIETDQHRITGDVLLPVEGYRSRLTDYLNANERQFIALTNVLIEPLFGPPRKEQREFIAVSLRHIVLVMPAAGSRLEASDVGR